MVEPGGAFVIEDDDKLLEEDEDEDEDEGPSG